MISLQTKNSTGDPWMSFQLNVVLTFTNNNVPYVYWIQDVAQVDTATNKVYFLDNVWNFSSRHASMSGSGISGGGQVATFSGTGYYYDLANQVAISISYPATLTFLVMAQVDSSNRPTVVFEYNVGLGFVSYDTVTFVKANRLTSLASFEVNGNTYNPFGNFYDSELVLGGVGGGYNTTDIQSDVRLSLNYWNGHNYQTVSNAFDFGSDTAEGISNVRSEGYYLFASGSLFARVQAGAGSLGKLYSQSQTATIDIKSPVSSGTLHVLNTTNLGGTPGIYPFINGDVTVVVHPGTYLLQVYQNGLLYDEGTRTLSAGQSLFLVTPISSIQMTISYSITGGGSGYPPPSLTFVHAGSQQTVTLTATPTIYYMDSGTAWTVSSSLQTSSGERWQTNQMTAGIASSFQTMAFTYRHQYLVTFAFQVSGGDGGYSSPTIQYMQFGSLQTTNPDSPVWVDASSTFVYTNPLQGSTSTERWYTSAPTNTVNAPGTTTTTFHHQFSLSFAYTFVGGAAPALPTLSGTQDGSPLTQGLISSDSVWLDSGTAWSVANPLTGSTDHERWQTNSATSGMVVTGSNAAFTYYHQYGLGLSYSVLGDGNPPSPQLSAQQFSRLYMPTLGGNPTTYFLDAGSTWSIPPLLGGSTSQERWTSSVTSSGTVSGGMTLQANYKHQYHIASYLAPSAGGSITNSTGWYDAGTSVQISAYANQGWKFAGWTGFGNGAYTGTLNLTSILANGPIKENATFYPGLRISAGENGAVSYAYDTQTGFVPGGTSLVVYAPVGSEISLSANPSSLLYQFSAWAPISGNAGQTTVRLESPSAIQGTFSLNLVVVGGIAGAIAAIALVSIIALRGKSSARRLSLSTKKGAGGDPSVIRVLTISVKT
jgi:hypothetical protein